MKAAVFHKPGDIRVDNVPDPAILDPRDVILKVTATAICGSDLHILSGAVPQKENLIMGHEFMGIVEEVGSEITNLKKGDRVVVPFPIACGKCFFCTHEASPACENSNFKHYGPNGDLMDQKGGALFGYTDLYGGYSGGQAEYVRVPYADISPRIIPEHLTDEQALFLTDIFPTGWSAIDWANLKGGETVAIFGSGPVGLMAQKAAWLNGAGRVIAIDPLDYRLEKAKAVNNVEILNPHKVDVIQAIREMTDGRGADVCVDAVGFEPERNFMDKVKATINFEKGSIKVLEMCFEAVRRMGTVSIMGVYGSPYDNFPLFRIFDKGITIKQGQAPVLNYIDKLVNLVSENKVVLDDIITHTIPLTEAEHGYKIFNEKEDDCVKVVLKP
ncbi:MULTISPECIES: zinc-dependent alcohol dehydrogenase [Sphingobacterium]|uniref:Zinc-dependent alcohol dehydrogenase n=3 Tax=Sphingobacterium TaxID=28453 RepID=A0ACD5C547_9SPHI|nr:MULTISPECIES: zinc-dependent alcohol dehydrogenase [Sphingobacterium]HAF36727.1 glutathione-dependent formaldehyde dehydrogenase [Sphingobacterium sp.]QQT45425.1 glutathione-dependent formaldehyde dehydrogenase [Sphingobacterium multivorum]QQT61940.1 glutathione-dependent formaldehyde dehydrogenase [Sphingobacterium multivorum]QRQ63777.1 glutathione-dependent formaldehyde dehydrogenase [Sphingobacterium multivorum]SPZ85618.1 Glutathione-independent formaldehyde dehydrogenase [Sphingobacteri